MPPRKNPEPSRVFRLARKPDPWQPLPWSATAPDGTFGNRFDDPRSTYRVLYASDRKGSFLETLARFRVDLALVVQLQEIQNADDPLSFGVVPASWHLNRVIGAAGLNGRYADTSSGEWLDRYQDELNAEAHRLRVGDAVASLREQRAPRALTQSASRLAFEKGFDGIFFRSRFGYDSCSWALFEPFLLQPEKSAEIAPDDPDLQFALEVHGLRFEAHRA